MFYCFPGLDSKSKFLSGDDDENNWYFGPVIRNDEGLACLSLLLEAGAKTGLEEANEEGRTSEKL